MVNAVSKLNGVFSAGGLVIAPIILAFSTLTIVVIKMHKCAFDSLNLVMVDEIEGLIEF